MQVMIGCENDFGHTFFFYSLKLWVVGLTSEGYHGEMDSRYARRWNLRQFISHKISHTRPTKRCALFCDACELQFRHRIIFWTSSGFFWGIFKICPSLQFRPLARVSESINPCSIEVALFGSWIFARKRTWGFQKEETQLSPDLMK